MMLRAGCFFLAAVAVAVPPTDAEGGATNGGGDACTDANIMCDTWSSEGFCAGDFSDFMISQCRKSCKHCVDLSVGTTNCARSKDREGEEIFCARASDLNIPVCTFTDRTGCAASASPKTTAKDPHVVRANVHMHPIPPPAECACDNLNLLLRI